MLSLVTALDRTDFFFQRNLHDKGVKTVFNEQGNWNGDEVIDITFRQPAAKTFSFAN